MSGRGVLFTGGEGPARDRIEDVLQGSTFIVAADSGWDLARRTGVSPDLVVGDMDSIRERRVLEVLPSDRVLIFEREKDETDTEIGLRILFERGITDVTLIGGGGGRLDHLMGILAMFDRDVRPQRWITRTDEVISIEGHFCAPEMKGRLVSFFPAGSDPCEMRSAGLRWPLDGLVWRRGDVGISNYGVADEVEVEMIRGRLIMVLPATEGRNGRALGF